MAQAKTRLTAFSKLLIVFVIVVFFLGLRSLFNYNTTEEFYDKSKIEVGDCVSWKDRGYKVTRVIDNTFTDEVIISPKINTNGDGGRDYTVSIKKVVKMACTEYQ